MISHNPEGSKPILQAHYTIDKLPQIIRYYNKRGFTNGQISILGKFNKTLMKAAEELALHGIDSQSPKTYLKDNTVLLLIYDILRLKGVEPFL